MSHPVPLRLRVEKNIVTRIKRALDGKGNLNVRIGQQISPDEIIGTAASVVGFRIINLSSELGVSPKEAGKFLVKKLNQRIYTGELLALKKGSFLGGKKIITSPSDGILEFLNPETGELKLSFLPRKRDLLSGVYGIVDQIDKVRGQVTVRAMVTKVNGVFGTGKQRDGVLHILGRKDELINKSAIKAEFGEYVLMGGSLIFKDSISTAISQGIKGIISGGINADDYKAMAGGRLVFPKKLDNDIGISIVVCEGFGAVPIGDDIFEILSEYEGKFISVDGNKGIINLPSFSSASLNKVETTQLPEIQNDNSLSTIELKVGLKVRVIGNSYFGEQGKILAINNTSTLLLSGIRTPLVTVETSRKKIQLPVANLEVVL
ncbi:MAG: hypothetical protein Q7R77_03400 [Candidatus Daviesbacteria bacterium]|nr:hypothetical protein [Candidatus Daviesbacteria bacterium]